MPDRLLEVEDARLDSRFADGLFVRARPAIIRYAGAPLVMPGGEAIGTLCVLGCEPGRLDAVQLDVLEELAREVVRVLLLREPERSLEQEEGGG